MAEYVNVVTGHTFNRVLSGEDRYVVLLASLELAFIENEFPIFHCGKNVVVFPRPFLEVLREQFPFGGTDPASDDYDDLMPSFLDAVLVMVPPDDQVVTFKVLGKPEVVHVATAHTYKRLLAGDERIELVMEELVNAFEDWNLNVFTNGANGYLFYRDDLKRFRHFSRKKIAARDGKTGHLSAEEVAERLLFIDTALAMAPSEEPFVQLALREAEEQV